MLIALVLLLVAFSPALRAHYVYDDRPYVAENSAVASPTFKNVFAETFPPERSGTGLYRPVLTLTLIADRASAAMTGLSPATLGHLQNLLLHAAMMCLLALLLVRFLGVDPIPGAMTALLVALHPAGTEAVCWISARSELLSGVLGMAGLLLLAGNKHTHARWWAAAFLVGALLAKESAIVWPLLWGVILWAGTSDRPKALGHRLWPALAVAGCYVVLHFLVTGGLSPDIRAFEGCTPETRAAVVSMSWWRYVRLVVWPTGLTAHWPPLPMSIVGWQVALGATLFFALATLGGTAAFARTWLPAAAGAWFLIALLPVSNTVVPIGTIMAERFLYVPLISLGLVAASFLQRKRVRRTTRRIATLVLLPLILLAGITTFKRAQVWKNDITLWTAAEESSPRDMVAGVAHTFYLVKSGSDRHLHVARIVWPRVRRIVFGMPEGTLPAALMERARWIDARLAASPEKPHPSS